MPKSKVAQTKENVGWRKSGPRCCNCKHFKSEIIKKEGFFGEYMEEKMKRCRYDELSIFATGKIAWCEKHEFTD